MKKLTAKLLSLLLLCGLFAGCGSTPSPGSGESGAGASGGDKAVVRVQWIGDFQNGDFTDPVSGKTNKGLSVLTEEFERLHPDIKLQFILMGWDDYEKKTQTMLMSGESDVYQMPGIAAVANQGLLEPLAPYIERDSYDLGVYIDGLVDGWKVVGPEDNRPQIYGLPMIGDTRIIIYDKQLFDQWGVPYLSETPTPEEIIEAASKMTGKNPVTGEENYGLFHKGTDGRDIVMNLSEHYGGTWGTGNRPSEFQLNFDSPQMVKAFETLLEINKYCPAGVMSYQGGELFGKEDNNIAINMRCNPNSLSNIIVQGMGERYAVARLFVNPAVGKGGLFAGSPVGIAANSGVKDAAWEYLKFTGSDFFMNYFWENQLSQGLPVLKAAFELEAVKADPNLSMMLESMQYLWTPRYVYRPTQPGAILTTAVENVTLNGKPVEETLQQAQKEAMEWVANQ